MTSPMASCPSCRAPVQEAQRFCHECGGRLGAPEGAGERRPVSAIRCRLTRGAMADEAPSEATLSLLDAVHEEVTRYGGVVHDSTGDGASALVGVPEAHEDHARRAVLAALAITERLGRATTAIGVSSGDVALTMDGARVVGAVGDAVSEAARLAARASAGAVLIGAATEEAVRGYVTCDPEPAGADHEPGWVVTGPGSRVSRLDAAHRRLTRFVGRDRQLRALGELLDEALSGRGQAVNLVGDAGMGKSRLAAEFLESAAATVRVREGRCLSFAGATPFVPIADIVRAQTGVEASASPDRLLPGILARLASLGLDTAAHAPYLARLLGAPEAADLLGDRSPESIRESTLRSLVALFSAEATESPTILLIEDLHWIDAVSEDVIQRWVEALPGRRAMVLCTSRPGFRAPWMGVSYATQLALPPLDAEASRAVVDAVVGGAAIPPMVLDRAVARGDGNPFFLEELGHAVAGDALVGADVPATVQDVILSRIDRLDAPARRLLRTAAVLGREFPRTLLDELWGSREDVDRLVDDLRRRDFLYEEGGGTRLQFRHALTNEVAYGTLLDGRRRELHRQAGEALERLHADRLEEVYGLLGHHFSRAGDDGRAVEYLARAAERALEAYSNESAAEALELALGHVERSGDGALRARAPVLIFRLAFTLYLLGRFADALAWLESPLGAGEHDIAVTAEHEFWLSYIHAHLGHATIAQEHAERAIVAAEKVGDRFTVGRTVYVLTREDWWMGRYAAGVAHGRRAVSLLQGPEEWWWLGHASAWTGLNHLLRGEFEEALVACRRMHEIGVRRDDPRLQSYADWNIGWIEATRGNTSDAASHCLRSLERSPDPINSSYSTWALAFAHREAGDVPRAVAALEEAIDFLQRTGYLRLVGWLEIWLGEAHLSVGRTDQAGDVISDGLNLARSYEFPWAIGMGVRAQGRLAEAEGRRLDAERRLAEAHDLFADQDAAFEAAVTRLDLARVVAGGADLAAARAHAVAARDALMGMAAPVWAARAADAVESLGEAPGRSAAPLGDGGSPMRVTTLGRLAVVINDREVAPAALGGDLGRQILGALLAAGGSVHRDRLRAWLRPDAPLEDGDADLDAALAALTETLGRDRIAVDGPVSRLALRAKDSWDIAELREAAPPAGPPEEIAATLEGLRDAPFAEWPGAEWARPALDAWSAHVRHLRGALADALMREGRLDEARGELGRLAQAEPEDERWQRALMRCHAAAGDMPLALRQYHACRSTLRRMLGTDPSPETQALYLELLAGRRGGDGP